MFLCAIGSTMLIFADGPDKYYKIVLPALIIGTVGGANAYICCSECKTAIRRWDAPLMHCTPTDIAMMQSAPKEFAGVMGAMCVARSSAHPLLPS